MTSERTRNIPADHVRPAGAKLIGQASGGAARPGAAARIVETDEAGAMIEVTCRCGERVYLRCEYAAAAAQ